MTNPKEFLNLGFLLIAVFTIGAFFYFRSQPDISKSIEQPLIVNENTPDVKKKMGDEEVMEIELSSFKFSQDKLTVKPGQTVTIRLTNSEGFHDFVIDELGVASEQISVGDETTVTFTIPENAAGETYEYYCSVSNHRELGMVGLLTVESEERAAAESGGKYIAYTPKNFADAADTRRVIYFYANWCPTCQPADKDFQDNMDKLPQDITVLRANYSDGDTDQGEKDLAKKYGVTYQHTFVQVDEAGKELTKWNGGQLDELLANIR